MDLKSIPMFAMMTKRMGWHGKRQDVLAQNIANADTPHYQARDLKPLSFREALGQTMAATQTSPLHLSGTKPTVRGANMRETYEVSPVGNAVSLEEQATLVAKNAMDYTLTTQLYSKSLQILRTAIGRGN